jgi:hypothetical protein
MHIVQIFIPLFDQGGEQFDERLFTGLKEKLTGYFGGVTIYQRAPATGLWKEGGKTIHDQIIIFEIMAPEIDSGFWKAYKAELESQFRQQEILIRSFEITVIS